MAVSDSTHIPEISSRTHVVVCGTGSIGMRHLSVLRDRLKLDPIALPTRSARIPELRAKGIRAVESWQDGAGNEPQFAIIATDTARHLEDASAALKLGATVLVEKPIASTVHGLLELADLAESCNRKVFVACNLRFDSGLLMFRRHLENIGRVHTVRIECQSFLPEWRPGTDYRKGYAARPDEGGVLRDLIHEIDYAIWLFGRPTQLFAQVKNSGRLGIDSDESADLLWEASSGAIVSIRLDYLTRISRRRMRAFGDFGDIEWDATSKSVTLSLSGQSQQSWKIEQGRDDMMSDQAAAFLLFAEVDENPSLTSFDEGAFAIAVCDTARKSSVSRRVEQIVDWRSL